MPVSQLLMNVKMIVYQLTAYSTFALPYSDGLVDLLPLFGILVLAGPGANLVWLLCGSRLHHLLVRHRVVSNTVMALALVACAALILALATSTCSRSLNTAARRRVTDFSAPLYSVEDFYHALRATHAPQKLCFEGKPRRRRARRGRKGSRNALQAAQKRLRRETSGPPNHVPFRMRAV